jgi:hypothetical protein
LPASLVGTSRTKTRLITTLTHDPVLALMRRIILQALRSRSSKTHDPPPRWACTIHPTLGETRSLQAAVGGRAYAERESAGGQWPGAKRVASRVGSRFPSLPPRGLGWLARRVRKRRKFRVLSASTRWGKGPVRGGARGWRNRRPIGALPRSRVPQSDRDAGPISPRLQCPRAHR